MIEMRDHRCHVPAIEKRVNPLALEHATTAVLGVMGMGCPNCAIRVRNALLSEVGVLAVEIELQSGLARVAYDARQATSRALLEAVAAAGDDRHCYQAILV